MNVPQPANTRLVERFTELAIQTFLWAFRIVVVLVVVVGSILTLAQGRYGAQTWIDLAITGAALGSVYALDRPGLHDGLRHPAHDQLRPRRDLHGRHVRRLLHCRRPGRQRDPRRRPAGRAPVGRHHVRGRRRGCNRDRAPGRADRLPASAERAAARAADLARSGRRSCSSTRSGASSAPASTPTRRSTSSRARSRSRSSTSSGSRCS